MQVLHIERSGGAVDLRVARSYLYVHIEDRDYEREVGRVQLRSRESIRLLVPVHGCHGL